MVVGRGERGPQGLELYTPLPVLKSLLLTCEEKCSTSCKMKTQRQQLLINSSTRFNHDFCLSSYGTLRAHNKSDEERDAADPPPPTWLTRHACAVHRHRLLIRAPPRQHLAYCSILTLHTNWIAPTNFLSGPIGKTEALRGPPLNSERLRVGKTNLPVARALLSCFCGSSRRKNLIAAWSSALVPPFLLLPHAPLVPSPLPGHRQSLSSG